MTRETLFTVGPAKSYQIALPEAPKAVLALADELTRRRLAQNWTPLRYDLFRSHDGLNLLPDMCFSPPALLFRADLQEEVFPRRCQELEFLPVVVGTSNWLMLNCLKTTRMYDGSRSKFGRDRQIFFIEHITIKDPSLRECEVFTLEDSNRAWPIVLTSFKRRIERLGIGGIKFREIGVLEDS